MPKGAVRRWSAVETRQVPPTACGTPKTTAAALRLPPDFRTFGRKPRRHHRRLPRPVQHRRRHTPWPHAGERGVEDRPCQGRGRTPTARWPTRATPTATTTHPDPARAGPVRTRGLMAAAAGAFPYTGAGESSRNWVAIVVRMKVPTCPRRRIGVRPNAITLKDALMPKSLRNFTLGVSNVSGSPRGRSGDTPSDRRDRGITITRGCRDQLVACHPNALGVRAGGDAL